MNHYLFFNHISICDSDGGVPWDMAHPLFLAHCVFASIVILAAHPQGWVYRLRQKSIK